MFGDIFKKVFQDLLFLILKLIDGICRLFGIMVGLEEVNYTSNNSSSSSTLINFFLEQDLFVQIFLTLFLISIIVLAVCSIFAVFRTMFSEKGVSETKTHTKIIGQSVKSIITTCLIFVITLTSISFTNLLLQQVNYAITGQEGIGISRVILELGLTNEATEIDMSVSNAIKDYQLSPDKIYITPANCREEYDTKEEVQALIEKNGNIWDEENGAWNWYVTKPQPINVSERKAKIDALFDENGHLKEDVSADKIWGSYTTNFVGLPNGGWDSENAAINGSGYNALMPYIAAFRLLYILCMTCFNLVKRLFDIIILFFVLPFVNATVPLDDGAHMKLWRETMISKILLAFGAVVSIAVFNIFAPLITELAIYDGNVENTILTTVLRLLLIVGGGLSINGGMVLISRLVGTGIAEGNEMGQSAKTLLAGGLGAVALGTKALKGTKTALFGKKQVDGTKSKGLLALTGAGIDTAGKMLGGNAYKSATRGVAQGTANALSKVKGSIMNNNGILGRAVKEKPTGFAGAVQNSSGRKL